MKDGLVIGIDLGGTFVKGGVVDGVGNLLATGKIPTPASREFYEVVKAIAVFVDDLCVRAGVEKSQIIGVGVACPGNIDGNAGVVVTTGNLRWCDKPLKAELSSLCNLPVEIVNDAEAALLAEMFCGEGKGYDSVVMITIGTGIGSSVYKYGRILERTELGHTVIQQHYGARKCTCGRRGCFETYASATALVRDTKEAVKRKETAMRQEKEITGKTAFDYYHTDAVAKSVVDNYLKRLTCGIANAVTTFHPQRVILGGGVCAQGDGLIKPLSKYLADEKYCFAEIVVAKNQNNAGVIGASSLFR